MNNDEMMLPGEWIVAAGATGAALTSAGDKVVFSIPCKCVVARVGAVVTTTCAGATTPVLDFDLRPTAGSDTGRTSGGPLGHLLLGTTAAGKAMYDRAAENTLLYPGQEVVAKCATAATTAGTCRPWLVVKPVPEEYPNLTAMVETA